MIHIWKLLETNYFPLRTEGSPLPCDVFGVYSTQGEVDWAPSPERAMQPGGPESAAEIERVDMCDAISPVAHGLLIYVHVISSYVC